MKKQILTGLFVVIAFLLGIRVERMRHPEPVHAQSASPAYVCSFGNGGTANTSPCTQYIVEVSTARLGGGVYIYQVTDNPVDVSTLNEVTAAAGTISGTSVQEPLPDNGGGTFTLAVTQP